MGPLMIMHYTRNVNNNNNDYGTKKTQKIMYSLPLVGERRIHATVMAVLGILVASPKNLSPGFSILTMEGPRQLGISLGLLLAYGTQININFLGLRMPGLVILPQTGAALRSKTLKVKVKSCLTRSDLEL